MRFGQHWDGYPPDDPPTDHEGFRWCSEHGSWECDCEESNEAKLSLDKTEATCQYFDEVNAKESTGGEAGGGLSSQRVHASPTGNLLQLDYPVWRLSFSEYGNYKGWTLP